MRKVTLMMACLFLCTLLKAQEKDSVAIMLLDRMSDIIGDLSSCSFTVNTVTDHLVNNGVVSSFSKSEVYLSGPDKMMINSNGSKGHRGVFYDSTILTYYSFTENNFASIRTPHTTLATIDSIHSAYDIDFPAADFFYPTFADDFINYVDHIRYMGTEEINGQQCFYIYGTGKEADVQLWISDDALMLPARFVVHYKGAKDIQRYEANYTAWQPNITLPVSMFDFMPPPGAHEVYLMPKVNNN